MYLGKDKTKHPAQQIAKLNMPDARRVLPKGLPCLYLTIESGEYTISATGTDIKAVTQSVVSAALGTVNQGSTGCEHYRGHQKRQYRISE